MIAILGTLGEGAFSECAVIVAGTIVEANRLGILKGKLKARAPGSTNNTDHLMMGALTLELVLIGWYITSRV